MPVTAKARAAHVTQTLANESMSSSPATGTLTDNAAWNAGGFMRLNAAVSSTKGNIYWTANLPPVFTASSDIAISNTSGADSMWFFFGTNVNTTLESGTTGYGYLIERNEFSAVFRIRYGGTTLATSSSFTRDTSFDSFSVSYNHGTFTIKHKGSTVLTYTDSTTRTFPGNRFGWGSRSGGTSNNHDCKNLLVTGSYNV